MEVEKDLHILIACIKSFFSQVVVSVNKYAHNKVIKKSVLQIQVHKSQGKEWC